MSSVRRQSRRPPEQPSDQHGGSLSLRKTVTSHEDEDRRFDTQQTGSPRHGQPVLLFIASKENLSSEVGRGLVSRYAAVGVGPLRDGRDRRSADPHAPVA